MTGRLTAIVDDDEDSLRIYPMPADSLAQVKVFGKPELTRVEDFFWAGRQPSGGKKT
ncbi:MAG: CRISPR-associated endonuclease Cas2 [Candidatus Riflebacteria bacterium]|nr:CRISPR-associated endonuclease Cas2 [Candidatus Riflebacteria bacterium]